MALGVAVLKQTNLDILKCFNDISINKDSAIFRSEALLDSLDSFSTFEMFAHLLVK